VGGELYVGFLDENYRSRMRAIGVRPERDAYELVIVDGAPWVIAANADGFSAHHMCVAVDGRTDRQHAGFRPSTARLIEQAL